MTRQEKIKMGLGLAASVGAGAIASTVLSPVVAEVKGGWILRILTIFGAGALAGAAADAAMTQTDKTVDTYYELAGMIKKAK